jgi:hypothetical protein
MFYFIQRRALLVASFLIFIFLFTFLCSPAYAWKLKTHAYIANIVMDDAKDGKVWIPPYGEFEVRPEVVEAINLCPEFFRGGSIGPDGFPDFWTGQAKIHPNTDPWLMLLWNSLPPLNVSPTVAGAKKAYLAADNEKRQAWAFTFGYFSHCAGDMWAHDWVNIYAGKAFPGVSEMVANPTLNVPVAVKHIAIENTLDKRIPLSTSTIDIPNDHVINTMILNRQAIALGMNPIASYFASKYFEKLPHKGEKEKVVGFTTPVKTYDACWFDDLDRGFRSTDGKNPGWMEANKRAIKDVMEKNKGMIGALGDYLGMWSVTYFFDMLGFPSVTTIVGGTIAENQAEMEWALNKIGIGEDKRSQITSDIVNVLLILSLGFDKTIFDMIWSAEMTSQLFDAQTTAEIMADISMPPSEATWKAAWTDQTIFDALKNSINGPLYNSVITTKIAMLKPAELERLVGKKLPGVTGEVVILGVLKGIDFSRQFSKPDGLTDNWLGYGMNLTQLQDATWRPIFPVVFKPYGPRDTTKQEVWSSSLDANHRWAGIYPVTPQMLIKPPVVSNIAMSQFNSETIEVEFKSNKEIASAALEYQTPSAQTKITSWFTGQSLQPASGMKYTISLHEAGMPAGIYKIRIKVKDAQGAEAQTSFSDFVLFGTSTDWGFTATPGANNTYVLSWNKYPRSGEFQKYVLDKGTQIASSSGATTAHATSYDADQMPQQGFQPIEITNINATTKTIATSLLTDLTLSARSKRGNFLTKTIAPTVVQAQTTTPSSTTTTATTAATSTTTTQSQSTPTGTTARQRYQ